MTPTRDNLLIEKTHPEYQGLIQLIDHADAKEIMVEGRVLAVGPRVRSGVKVGDSVIFSTRGNTPAGPERVLIGEKSIAATIEPE
jgi:co-chaperonin GroES (HSP10)